MKAITLLAIGVTTLLCAPLPLEASGVEGADAPQSGSSELTDRAVRKWQLELPAEKFVPVGQGFSLSETLGCDFKAAPEGTSLKIDSDGDGEFDVTAEGPSSMVTLTGTNGRRYAVRLVDQKGWRYAPGGVLRGKILGERIQLIDQNLDGDYRDIGEDAIVIGRSKIASFLSEVVAIDGELVELFVAPDGSKIDYRPFRGATGTLKLGPCETKAKVLSAVVRSQDGRYCFDVAKVQAGQRVPVGKYSLVSGTIGLGKNSVRMVGGRSKSFTVATDGTREVTWGGPVKAEFAYRHSGGEVALSPDQVWYFGAAGEEYVGWTPIGKSPEFSIRNKKTGREIAQAYFPGTC